MVPEASERRIDFENIDLLLGLKVKTCRSGSYIYQAKILSIKYTAALLKMKAINVGKIILQTY